jgi:hypothetical protein
MNLVRESISFQRGADPKKQMGVGIGLSPDPMPGLNDYVDGVLEDPESLQFNVLRQKMLDAFRIMVDNIIIKGLYEEFEDSIIGIERDASYMVTFEVGLKTRSHGNILIRISPSSNYQSFEAKLLTNSSIRDTTKMARSVKILNKNIKKMLKDNKVEL